MKINIFQWRYSPFLMLLALWLPTGNAQAAVNCTASMPTVNLGDITPANADDKTISANLNYKCKNTFLESRRVYVCLAVDGGDKPEVVIPRYMSGPNTPRLAFTMTLSGGTLWSTRNNLSGGTEYKSVLHDIPGGGSISIDVPINISLLPSNDNTSATPGIYTNNFNGGHTALTTDVSPYKGDGSLLDCTKGSQGTERFPFIVQATVIKDCKVTTTGALDFGSVISGSTPTPASSSADLINVTCTKGTPYKIGLSPSNGNVEGMGVMKNSTATDTVPYQLRSTAGIAGKIWGNTATSTTVGNGVAGIGNGISKGEAVFATVANTDVKPDTYSDTVTVHVNY